MLRAVGTTTEPLVHRLNVVYLYVSEMERSLGFYRDLLGIPLEGDEDWQEASLGETRFALHLAHEGICPLSAGSIHVNLEVVDLDAATERLHTAGVEVERPCAKTGAPRRGSPTRMAASSTSSNYRPGSVEDYTKPILSGEGESDYERYLRTDELLSFSAGPRSGPTAASSSSRPCTRPRSCGCSWPGRRSRRRRACSSTRSSPRPSGSSAARSCVSSTSIGQLEMLEQMSPWEYQADPPGARARERLRLAGLP